MRRFALILSLLFVTPGHAQVQDGTQIMKMIGIGVPFVLVLGDSLAAGVELPPEVCGLPLVKIGVGGARPSTFITLAEDMNAYNVVPKLVVIAVGINSALNGYQTNFRTTYSLLIDSLPKTPLALATTAPIDPAGSDGSRVDLSTMASVNSIIRDVAKARGATLVELGKLQGFETKDGIHPTEEAKPMWRDAVIDGIRQTLECHD